MNQYFYKFSGLSAFLPSRFFTKLTAQKLILPFYHVVSNEKVIHIKHLYPVRSSRQFETDLDFLLKNFQAIDLPQLLEWLRSGKKVQKPSFLLTFDDGLREFHDVAAPILLKKGIPAVNFLNTAFIDNKDLFYRYKAGILIEQVKKLPSGSNVHAETERLLKQQNLFAKNVITSILNVNYADKDLLNKLANLLEIDFATYVQQHKPYMSTAEIKTLIDQGFYFGAHSVDHPKYEDISLQHQLQQTMDSIRFIKDTFAQEIQCFSFPFTDFGVKTAFFNTLFNSENNLADLSFGCAGLKKDSISRHLQRIPIETGHFTAKQVVRGEYLYYLFKGMFNKNKIVRS